VSDKVVYSSDPDWARGSEASPRQPEPVRLAFQRGAKGSGVTRVERLVMHPTHKDAMLTKLKKALGCGGTLKDGNFEFQGDHRDKLEKMLLADGFKVKRIGG
jgi:translation initiation factor 1